MSFGLFGAGDVGKSIKRMNAIENRVLTIETNFIMHYSPNIRGNIFSYKGIYLYSEIKA